ncbi:MAG: hypothetical protein JSS46_03150 [Proteobacteria bacterium]|jgi:hypothetical protein|nr:hypothetical protein [Pseudomonadota bacterium]
MIRRLAAIVASALIATALADPAAALDATIPALLASTETPSGTKPVDTARERSFSEKWSALTRGYPSE